jgi:uroporphyrinogen III methyltransferase/synthase
LRAGRFAWVVLASQNAGRALVVELRSARIVSGVATAAALGLTPHIPLERFSAAAALEALRPHLQPGERVLVPRGAEGRDELLDGLRGLGVNVVAPVAYRTAAAEPFVLASEVRGRHFDAITVCSPSALGALLAANLQPEIQAAALVCLGDTTALAAREAGLRVDAVATTTSMGALVDAVRSALAPEAVV